MTLRRKVTYLILGAMVLGLCFTWFRHNFEKVRIEHVDSATWEARANSLLALERLLEGLGKTVHGVAHLDEMPPAQGTLFLPSSRRKISDEQIVLLKAWVADGGHLIVVASSKEGADADRLIEKQLGVGGRERTDSPQLVTIHVPGWEEPLDIEFLYSFDVDDGFAAGIIQIGSELGSHLVNLPSGRGFISVLSDFSFATNDRIGDHDHAAFIWYVLSRNPSPVVWVVSRVDSPSLWKHMVEHVWPVLVSMVSLLVLVLWVSCLRFGPIMPDPMPTRRRLLEHIEASGRFLWRYRQSKALLHAAQVSLLANLEIRHPGSHAGDNLHRKLSQVSGFSQEEIKLALLARDISDENLFTRLVRTLALIRNRL